MPFWETETTARAAVEQSVATSVMDVGSSALLTGAEGSFSTAARGPLSGYGLDLEGSYARATVVTIGEGATLPDDSASATLGTYGGWDLSPLTHLTLESAGYLATRLGVRAADPLAERDPFQYGNRLQYTVGAGPRLSIITSSRSSLDLGARYEQTGALAADQPEAVGVDTHEASAGVRYGLDVTAVDTLSPEVVYSYTHFYHALLDVNLNRGPAEVHAVTGRLVESHAFNRRTAARIGAGVTVASPPPILESQSAVVAPSALAGIIHAAKRYRLTADYAYEYTSLGPRIGFGQEHTATVELSFRPVRGGRYREVVVTGIGEVAVGSAPVAADPPLVTDPSAPPPSAEGVLTTVTAVAGAEIEYPLARGLVLLGRFDLEFVNAKFDPAPPAGQDAAVLRTVWTVGLAGTISTDDENLLRREEDEGEDVRGDAIGGAVRDRRAPIAEIEERGGEDGGRLPGAPAGLFGPRVDPPAAPQRVAPRRPADRRRPTDAVDGAQQPVEAQQPGQPLDPGQPAAPAPVGQPGQPGQPAQPGAAPAPAGRPGQPVQPGAAPAQPVQPGQPPQPGQPVQPGQPAQPGATPTQPGQPAQPTQPGQPAQPSPDAPAAPADPAAPTPPGGSPSNPSAAPGGADAVPPQTVP